MEFINLWQGWDAYTPDFTAEVKLNSKDISILKDALQGKEVKGQELLDQLTEIQKAIDKENKAMAG
jgi:hypothetical protein